jgi:hypothetical protein
VVHAVTVDHAGGRGRSAARWHLSHGHVLARRRSGGQQRLLPRGGREPPAGCGLGPAIARTISGGGFPFTAILTLEPAPAPCTPRE